MPINLEIKASSMCESGHITPIDEASEWGCAECGKAVGGIVFVLDKHDASFLAANMVDVEFFGDTRVLKFYTK